MSEIVRASAAGRRRGESIKVSLGKLPPPLPEPTIAAIHGHLVVSAN